MTLINFDKFVLALAIFFTAVLIQAQPGLVTSGIESTFDNDTEGWQAVGDSTSSIPAWNGSGGNPGGFIEVSDSVVGGVWYWSAPAKFLGDQSGALNKSLSFDLRQSSTSNQFSAVDIYLKSDSDVLVLDLQDNPGEDWTSYSVSFDTNQGWLQDSSSGPPASLTDLDTVLSSLTAIEIRGEYVTGADTGGLDNVVLVPEPGAFATVAGFLSLGLILARRRITL